MQTKTITRDFLDNAIGNGGVDGEIYDSYSGRGMRDETCVGVTFERARDVFGFFASLGREVAESQEYDEPEVDSELASDLARVACQDSMGMSTIVYFPGFVLVEE